MPNLTFVTNGQYLTSWVHDTCAGAGWDVELIDLTHPDAKTRSLTGLVLIAGPSWDEFRISDWKGVKPSVSWLVLLEVASSEKETEALIDGADDVMAADSSGQTVLARLHAAERRHSLVADVLRTVHSFRHDLANPLTVAFGSLHFLSRSAVSEDQQKPLSRLDRALNRMQEVMASMGLIPKSDQ